MEGLPRSYLRVGTTDRDKINQETVSRSYSVKPNRVPNKTDGHAIACSNITDFFWEWGGGEDVDRGRAWTSTAQMHKSSEDDRRSLLVR